MNENIKRKIELSNKIYPYFAGLTDDLMFWAAINTLFLTTVKNLTASQISLLYAIAVFSSIVLQGLVFKIIKKIGNIFSVRLGLVLLLIAAIIITFSNNIFLISIGQILYHLAFFFTSMGNVILKRNLKAVNEEENFHKICSKSSFIYAMITMIISFMAGFIFNINKYLPMILSIIICALNIFLSSFIYEYKYQDDENVKIKRKVNWKKILILIIIAYGLLYATLETIQENGKIFIQYYFQNFVEINKATIYLTIIIAFSRISRVLSNLLFNKMYLKLKNKLIVFLNLLLFLALILMIIGNITLNNMFGGIIMGAGFCILLFVRDPIMIFTKTELLNNCDIEEQESVMHKFNLSRKIVRCILALLISILLLKVKIIIIMLLLTFLIILYFILTITLSTILAKQSR